MLCLPSPNTLSFDVSIRRFSEISPKYFVSEPNLILLSEKIDLSKAKKSFPKEIPGATLVHDSDFLADFPAVFLHISNFDICHEKRQSTMIKVADFPAVILHISNFDICHEMS